MEYDGRHPLAVMQDYIDGRIKEVKLLCKFDIEKERSFYEMSVYDFYFHLSVKAAHGKENS